MGAGWGAAQELQEAAGGWEHTSAGRMQLQLQRLQALQQRLQPKRCDEREQTIFKVCLSPQHAAAHHPSWRPTAAAAERG